RGALILVAGGFLFFDGQGKERDLMDGGIATIGKAGSSFLRQNSKSARRETQAVFYLPPGHPDQRTLLRHLVEVGHRLDLIMPLLEEPRFGHHLLGRVGIERLVASRYRAALLIQELDGFKRPSWEWATLEFFRVVPVFVHVGA